MAIQCYILYVLAGLCLFDRITCNMDYTTALGSDLNFPANMMQNLFVPRRSASPELLSTILDPSNVLQLIVVPSETQRHSFYSKTAEKERVNQPVFVQEFQTNEVEGYQPNLQIQEMGTQDFQPLLQLNSIDQLNDMLVPLNTTITSTIFNQTELGRTDHEMENAMNDKLSNLDETLRRSYPDHNFIGYNNMFPQVQSYDDLNNMYLRSSAPESMNRNQNTNGIRENLLSNSQQPFSETYLRYLAANRNAKDIRDFNDILSVQGNPINNNAFLRSFQPNPPTIEAAIDQNIYVPSNYNEIPSQGQPTNNVYQDSLLPININKNLDKTNPLSLEENNIFSYPSSEEGYKKLTPNILDQNGNQQFLDDRFVRFRRPDHMIGIEGLPYEKSINENLYEKFNNTNQPIIKDLSMFQDKPKTKSNNDTSKRRKNKKILIIINEDLLQNNHISQEDKNIDNFEIVKTADERNRIFSKLNNLDKVDKQYPDTKVFESNVIKNYVNKPNFNSYLNQQDDGKHQLGNMYERYLQNQNIPKINGNDKLSALNELKYMPHLLDHPKPNKSFKSDTLNRNLENLNNESFRKYSEDLQNNYGKGETNNVKSFPINKPRTSSEFRPINKLYKPDQFASHPLAQNDDFNKFSTDPHFQSSIDEFTKQIQHQRNHYNQNISPNKLESIWERGSDLENYHPNNLISRSQNTTTTTMKKSLPSEVYKKLEYVFNVLRPDTESKRVQEGNYNQGITTSSTLPEEAVQVKNLDNGLIIVIRDDNVKTIKNTTQNYSDPNIPQSESTPIKDQTQAELSDHLQTTRRQQSDIPDIIKQLLQHPHNHQPKSNMNNHDHFNSLTINEDKEVNLMIPPEQSKHHNHFLELLNNKDVSGMFGSNPKLIKQDVGFESSGKHQNGFSLEETQLNELIKSMVKLHQSPEYNKDISGISSLFAKPTQRDVGFESSGNHKNGLVLDEAKLTELIKSMTNLHQNPGNVNSFSNPTHQSTVSNNLVYPSVNNPILIKDPKDLNAAQKPLYELWSVIAPYPIKTVGYQPHAFKVPEYSQLNYQRNPTFLPNIFNTTPKDDIPPLMAILVDQPPQQQGLQVLHPILPTNINDLQILPDATLQKVVYDLCCNLSSQ